MERRELLKHVLSAGALAGLAGCVYRDVPIGDEPTTDAAVPTAEGDATTEGGTETDVAETEATGTTEATTAAAGGRVVPVDVGPEEAYFRFDPERVEISVGDTVEWTARTEGHNVSAYPDAARQVQLPDGAEPFASYPEGESYRIIPVGEAYRHAFTVPGEYVYVCVPHVGEGMIGTVVVSE